MTLLTSDALFFQYKNKIINKNKSNSVLFSKEAIELLLSQKYW